MPPATAHPAEAALGTLKEHLARAVIDPETAQALVKVLREHIEKTNTPPETISAVREAVNALLTVQTAKFQPHQELHSAVISLRDRAQELLEPEIVHIPNELKQLETESDEAIAKVIDNIPARKKAEKKGRGDLFYKTLFLDQASTTLLAALKAGFKGKLTGTKLEAEMRRRMDELNELLKPQPEAEKKADLQTLDGFTDLTTVMTAVRAAMRENAAFEDQVKKNRQDGFLQAFLDNQILIVCLRAGAKGRPLNTPDEISAEMKRQAKRLQALLAKFKQPAITPAAQTAAAGAAPDSSTTNAPDVLSLIPYPALRSAVEKLTEANSKAREMAALCFELAGEDPQDSPALGAFQNRVETLVRNCGDLEDAKTPEDLAMLDHAVKTLLDELKESLTPETIETIEREKAEKARMRESLKIINLEPIRRAAEVLIGNDILLGNRLAQVWKLNQLDEDRSPRLVELKRKLKSNMDDIREAADGEVEGHILVVENLLDLIRREYPDDVLKTIEEEVHEINFEDWLLSVCSGLNIKIENREYALGKIIENILSVLTLRPEDIPEPTVRRGLIALQKAIRTRLHTKLPEMLGCTTATGDTLGKTLKDLEDMDLMKIQEKITQQVADPEKNITHLLLTLNTAVTAFYARYPDARINAEDRDANAQGGVATAEKSATARGNEPRRDMRDAELEEVDATRSAAHYPREGGRILPSHIAALMRNVLADYRVYERQHDPVAQAIQNVLQANEKDIDMAKLERFLKKPDLQVNDEIVAIQEEIDRIAANPANDHERHLASRGKTGALQALKTEAERELRNINEEIDRLTRRQMVAGVDEEEVKRLADNLQKLRDGYEDGARKKVPGRIQLEDRLTNLDIVIKFQAGNRRYGNLREVLAMITIYLRHKQGAGLTMAEVAEDMENAIETEAAKFAKRPWWRKPNLNMLKPTLATTLRHLTDKDQPFENIKPEVMEKLAAIHDKPDEIDIWIEKLGDKNIHYKTTIPKLIAYLEFALRDGRVSYMSSLSQKSTRILILNLKEARRRHVEHLLQDRDFKDDTDRMVSYFNELERNTVDQAKITSKFITRHSKVRMAVNAAKAAATAAGATLAVGGGIAMAPALGPFFTALALGSTLPPAAAATVGWLLPERHKKWKECLYRGAIKGLRGGAVAAGTLAGVGVLTAALGVASLPLGLIPAAAAGTAGIFLPQLYRNRGPIGRGTRKTAQFTGKYVARPSWWLTKFATKNGIKLLGFGLTGGYLAFSGSGAARKFRSW